MDSDKFCFSILSRYPIIKGLNGSIGIVGILFAGLYIFNTCLTIYWIFNQRVNGLNLGVERAARHVIYIFFFSFTFFYFFYLFGFIDLFSFYSSTFFLSLLISLQFFSFVTSIHLTSS